MHQDPLLVDPIDGKWPVTGGYLWQGGGTAESVSLLWHRHHNEMTEFSPSYYPHPGVCYMVYIEATPIFVQFSICCADSSKHVCVLQCNIMNIWHPQECGVLIKTTPHTQGISFSFPEGTKGQPEHGNKLTTQMGQNTVRVLQGDILTPLLCPWAGYCKKPSYTGLISFYTTLMSQQYHGISHHQSPNCLFSRLFRVTTKKALKFYEWNPLVAPHKLPVRTQSHQSCKGTETKIFKNLLLIAVMWLCILSTFTFVMLLHDYVAGSQDANNFF